MVDRPSMPSFTLAGRPVGGGPVPVAAGESPASLRLLGESGQLEDRLTFHIAPLAGSVPFETEVLRLTNQARARGWNCETLQWGGPARPPLKLDPRLEVAALAQSAGMALYGDFDHRSSVDGSTPAQRVEATGLQARASGENITAGQARSCRAGPTGPATATTSWGTTPALAYRTCTARTARTCAPGPRSLPRPPSRL
ncbi:MAG: CAP domain-containing protein [Deinococcota bacterium]